MNHLVIEPHKRIAGTLYIVFSCFQILGMLVLSFFVTKFLRLILSEAELDEQGVVLWLIPMLQAIAWGVIMLFSIPSIIAGVGLINNRRWALTLALILGCFKLFSFPFGTALGIYTIWIYAEDHKLQAASNLTNDKILSK
jgi:hypothetical protein